MTLRIAHPPGRVPERHWTAAVVFGDLLGLDHELVSEERDDVEITIGGDGRRVVLGDGLLSLPDDVWLTPESLPQAPVGELEGVPLLYRPPEAPDLLGDAFFHLSRYEEAVRPERDAHGRMPAESALAVRHGFVDRPVVDEAADLLFRLLQAQWPRLERRRHTFEVLPSHDVDWPYTTPRNVLPHAAADVRLAHRPGLAARRLLSVAARRLDPWDTFDFLASTAERRGLRSAFYFLAENGDRGGYRIEEPRARRLLRRLHARGHEIGFHAGYDTLGAPTTLRRELDRVRAAAGDDVPIEGGRQHFLRWQPESWRDWDEAGLRYDSTLGFSQRVGFRCGTCHEYPTFDLARREPLRLRERPLVAMEMSLLLAERATPDAALTRLTELKRQCRKHGGAFTLLWHNSYLLDAEHKALYEAVLDA